MDGGATAGGEGRERRAKGGGDRTDNLLADNLLDNVLERDDAERAALEAGRLGQEEQVGPARLEVVERLEEGAKGEVAEQGESGRGGGRKEGGGTGGQQGMVVGEARRGESTGCVGVKKRK